jgi:purine-cytosine permease-like protein
VTSSARDAGVIEIPFMNTTFYTGPLVKHLGGADISWIFGLIVAVGLYYILMRLVVGQSGQAATTGTGNAVVR